MALATFATDLLDTWVVRSWDDSTGLHYDLWVGDGAFGLSHYTPVPTFVRPFKGPPRIRDFRIKLVPLVPLIVMAIPGIWFYQWVRVRQRIAKVRQRFAKHLCRECGYSLTGNTSGTCPE